MASRAHHPVIPRLDAMEPERPPPALFSELLEEIFLRVASPADLTRASAACVSFRRLISNPAFLRRYRFIHPPPFLGFLHTGGFYPVEATHSSADVAWTADLSLDFPPSGHRWYPCDFRDGRVVVYRRRDMHVKELDMGTEYRFCWDLAVCDPLFRRYLLLPPITDDLLASDDLHNQDMRFPGASLIPSRGMEEETSFIVICWVISKTRLLVFFFSTSSGHWTADTSICWADLGLYEVNKLDSGQCVHGCFYWKVGCRNKLLKLDMNNMELSKYDLPPDHAKRDVIVMESGEGKVVMFSLPDEGTSMEYYTFMQNGTDSKWHLKSTIPLPVHGTSKFFITGQAQGYIFLAHITREWDTPCFEFLSLEVKSLNVERVCRTDDFDIFRAVPYFGFPLSLSPRRVQGYRED